MNSPNHVPGLNLFLKKRFVYPFLFVFAFLLYSNTFQNGYNIDDDRIIENNELTAQGISAIPEILTTNYLTEGNFKGSYRALARVSYAIEYQFFGAAPGPGHVINMLLYALTALLVYSFVSSLFTGYTPLFALVVAVLFIAHPVHTEVICSLKNRDELMSFMFGISAAIFILAYYRHGTIWKLILGLICFLFGIMSKESGQLFMALIPLALFFSGELKAKKLLLLMILLVLTSAVFWTYLLLILPHQSLVWMVVYKEAFPYVEHPLLYVTDSSVRYGTAVNSIGFYIRLLAFPHPLGFFYGFNQIALLPLINVRVFAIIAVCAALLLVAVKYRKAQPALSFGILGFFISVSMFSNLLIPMAGVVAERFIYQGSFSFSIALAWLLFTITNTDINASAVKIKWPLFAILLLLVSLYSYATFTRNFDWKDKLSLSAADSKSFKNSSVVHNVYAQALHTYIRQHHELSDSARLALGKQVIEELHIASRIHPQSAVYTEFQNGYNEVEFLKNPQAGLPHLTHALQLLDSVKSKQDEESDNSVPPFFIQLNIVRCYSELGRVDSAWSALQLAGKMKKGDKDFFFKKFAGAKPATREDSAALITKIIKKRHNDD